MKKIDSKITGYEVVSDDPLESTERPSGALVSPEMEFMHEGMKRPEMLLGSTYKIKSPNSGQSIYVTINDMVLNEGTDQESRRPYEMFINSRNMEQFQWVVALTLLISAIFRKTGDTTFLVSNLKDVFDPRGGYFKKGGVFMPSVVAEIGDVLERHFTKVGLLKKPEKSPDLQEFIDKKLKEARERWGEGGLRGDGHHNKIPRGDGAYPASAQLCNKCNVKASVLMDGCSTCLNCGDSKCG